MFHKNTIGTSVPGSEKRPTRGREAARGGEKEGVLQVTTRIPVEEVRAVEVKVETQTPDMVAAVGLPGRSSAGSRCDYRTLDACSRQQLMPWAGPFVLMPRPNSSSPGIRLLNRPNNGQTSLRSRPRMCRRPDRLSPTEPMILPGRLHPGRPA